MTNTPELLSNDDHCHRHAVLAREWERSALHPTDILRRAVIYGLESGAKDPAVAASDHALELCVARVIDTDSADLIGVAEHITALAEMIVYTVRSGAAWERPEDLDGWTSSAFLSPNGDRLRQLWIVNHWNMEKEIAARHSWYLGGEAAWYGIPLDLLVAIIGQRRDSRWVSPWTVGFKHPKSGDLRFRKRDGSEFGPTWERVTRERFKEREKWLNSLTDDGLLPEILLVREIPVSIHAEKVRALAEEKLTRLRSTALPAPQLSMCDVASHPCPFRSACPYWELPSRESGFIQIAARSAISDRIPGLPTR